MSTARCQASPCPPCGLLPAVGGYWAVFCLAGPPKHLDGASCLVIQSACVHTFSSFEPPKGVLLHPGCRDAGMQGSSPIVGGSAQNYWPSKGWKFTVNSMTVASRTWFSDFSYLLQFPLSTSRKVGIRTKRSFSVVFWGFLILSQCPAALGTLCAQVSSATRWGASISRARGLGKLFASGNLERREASHL